MRRNCFANQFIYSVSGHYEPWLRYRVVMDRGIATEERLHWLREHGYRYLVVSRERTRHFDPEAALRIETASKHGVHLHKVLSDDAHEVRLYCFSEERAAKERGIAERFARKRAL